MTNEKLKQLLIQVITLLDGARIGQRKETVLTLLQCACRASREHEVFTAQQQSVEALSIVLLESAIELLLTVQKEAQSDAEAMLMLRRYLLIIVGAGLAVSVLFVWVRIC